MEKDTTQKRRPRTQREGATRKNKRKQKAALSGALIVLLVVVAIVGVFLLGSCGNSYKADTTTLFVLEDGKVATTDVVPFDENSYSKDELKAYIKENITTYNEENGKDSVKQKAFKVDEGIATLTLEFASIDVYEDFVGTELFVGTLSDAMAAGYSFEGQFGSITEGKVTECTSEAFAGQSDLKVAIVKANTKIDIEGEILYLSAANVAEFGEDWVVAKDGYNLLAASALNTESQEATETINGTETTETTEESTEGFDEAVGEDELLVSTEEEPTEVIFDFGDDTSAENQRSDVYIYIIYR